MTPTERQRRWRHQKRLAATAEQPPESGTEPEQSAPPPEQATEQPAAVADHKLIRQLTRERDQARDERNALRRELDVVTEQRDDVVKGIMPKPEVVGDHTRACWCSFCGKRWGDNPEVEVMIVGSVRQRLFICSECIEGPCTEIIAAARRRKASEATGSTIEWTMQRIADALHVSPRQISTDSKPSCPKGEESES
jgi:hypothetical protein